MYIFLILAIIFAVWEVYAAFTGLRQLEYIAKPAVMMFLLIWFYVATGLQVAALWFGIWFSLFGDVLLLWSDRLFIFGLIAFVPAHISYIIGFIHEIMAVSHWSLILAVLLGAGGVRVLRRIIGAMRASGHYLLITPVVIYSIIITLMLYMAMLTLSDISWSANASLLVAAGAFSFFISDIVLAWNWFVSPISHGHTRNIVLYHAGQIMLVTGVINKLG